MGKLDGKQRTIRTVSINRKFIKYIWIYITYVIVELFYNYYIIFT